jgi:hypothetical protein
MKAELNFYEGECFAIIWVVSSFQCYFDGSPFTSVINHEPFKYFMELDRFMGMLAMWALILQEYDFNIVHKACRVN